MKKLFSIFLSVILLLSLTACQQDKEKPVKNESEFQKAEIIGTVPADFEKIISENLFHNALAFSDRFLKQIRSGNETLIVNYDIYGNILAEHKQQTDESHTVRTLTATSDGGFLYVLGFYDCALSDGTWASDGGIVSKIIKCDKNGQVQWETAFEDYEGGALEYCFEVNGRYYLFGARQTPETKQKGVYSYTDIVFACVNCDGKIIKTAKLGGSDYDYLQSAYYDGNTFVLYAYTQSKDGDFAYNNEFKDFRNLKIIIDTDLNVVSKEIVSGSEYSYIVGYSEGKPILRNDKIFSDFKYGTMTAAADYGDFYLTVSENRTGIYENTPQYSENIWYYTETVYAAIDKYGKVHWVATADSSPDYDKLVASLG